MKVVWSETVLRHLDAIQAYLALQSDQYAVRLIERIIHRAGVPETFPLIGGLAHRFDEAGVRELTESSYRIL